MLVEQHSPAMSDIAAALTSSLARDGRGGMLGNLAMNGNALTDLADGQQPTDAATVRQLVTTPGPAGPAANSYATTAGVADSPLTNLTAILTASGKEGLFSFVAGFAGTIDNIYAIASSVTGAAGAWVRVDRAVKIALFGALTSGTAAANNTAIQAALDFAKANNVGVVDFGDRGSFAVTGLMVSGSTAGLTLKGRAQLTTTANAPILSVTGGSMFVTVDGLTFTGNNPNADSGQSGVSMGTMSYCSVRNCIFTGLSRAFYALDSATGYPLSGGYQRPSEASGNLIRGCYYGIYTSDGNPGSAGEYWRFTNNTVTDCIMVGVFSHAGNIAFVGNTINGNNIGVILGSVGSVNGDHGLFVGNTVNHNVRANLYVDSNLRSWIIQGNNFWACLGGPNGNLTLGQALGITDGTMDFAYGVYLKTVHEIMFSGNVLGRNQVNFATNAISNSTISGNDFQTDPASTVAQYHDYAAPGITFNNYGPNNFTGALLASPFVSTGDPNRLHNVGATGEPAFANGWVNANSGAATVGFFKDPGNVIFLRGTIKSGTVGAAAFVLPAGYRPRDMLRNYPVISNGALGFVQVLTTGEVVVNAPSTNASVTLDNIAFQAA